MPKKSSTLVSPDYNTICHMVLVVFVCVLEKRLLFESVLGSGSYSSSNAAVGLLAGSMMGFILLLSSLLEGHPDLGNITVAPHFPHLLRKFHGSSKVLGGKYPSPDGYLMTVGS